MKIFRSFMMLALLFVAGTILRADDLQQLPLGTKKDGKQFVAVSRGKIVSASGGKELTLEQLVDELEQVDLIIIAEKHDSYHCHLLQRDLIKTLAAKGSKIILGLELFQREESGDLNDYLQGKLNKVEFLEKVGWYENSSLSFELTDMVLQAAKKAEGKAFGINVSRQIIRKISRSGFSSLTAQEKKLFPRIEREDPDHRFLIRRIFANQAAFSENWFENIYAAQKSWDIFMAESIRQLVRHSDLPGRKLIIVAGANHVFYKLGIPFRLEKGKPKLRLKMKTVVPVYCDSRDNPALHPMARALKASREPFAVCTKSLGDYLFGIDINNDRNPFDFGLKLEKTMTGLLIKEVSQGSFAEKAGLREGDLITRFNCRPLRSPADFFSQLFESSSAAVLTIVRSLPARTDLIEQTEK